MSHMRDVHSVINGRATGNTKAVAELVGTFFLHFRTVGGGGTKGKTPFKYIKDCL